MKGEGGWPPNSTSAVRVRHWCWNVLLLLLAHDFLRKVPFFLSPTAIDSRCPCCHVSSRQLHYGRNCDQFRKDFFASSGGFQHSDLSSLDHLIILSHRGWSSRVVLQFLSHFLFEWPLDSIDSIPWVWVNWWFNKFVTKHDQFSCAIAIKSILLVVPNSPLTWFKTRLARAYGMYVWYIYMHILHGIHISSYLYGYNLKPHITGSVYIKCTNQQKQLRVISQHLCNELHPVSRHFSLLTKPYTVHRTPAVAQVEQIPDVPDPESRRHRAEKTSKACGMWDLRGRRGPWPGRFRTRMVINNNGLKEWKSIKPGPGQWILMTILNLDLA